MVKKLLVIAFVIVPLLGMTACGGSSSDDEKSSSEKSSAEDGKPDLSGIPDVVATVDGHKIKKGEFTDAYEAQFQQMAMQAQQTGEEPDQDELKKQVADGLVGTFLLAKEADDRGVKASKDQVDKKLDELVEQSESDSKEKLFETLKEQQGMDKDKVVDEIKTQVKLEQLTADEAGDQKPSKKEVREYYDQMVEQQKESGQEDQVPSFKELRPQLEEQLASEKESGVQEKMVKKLRKDAKVSIKL